MIKNYNDFVTEQFDDFYDDLETSKKNLKLFTKFKKIKTDAVKTNFSNSLRIIFLNLLILFIL